MLAIPINLTLWAAARHFVIVERVKRAEPVREPVGLPEPLDAPRKRAG